jgi:hypothetical protein
MSAVGVSFLGLRSESATFIGHLLLGDLVELSERHPGGCIPDFAKGDMNQVHLVSGIELDQEDPLLG